MNVFNPNQWQALQRDQMFADVNPDQRRQALSMAGLQMGAGMLDPRGTGGSFGAALNKGVQQGMGAYVPMMMFAQQSAERKAREGKQDKRYSQEQKRLAQQHRDRMFMQQMGLEQNADNHSLLMDLRESSLQLNQSQFDWQKKQAEQQMGIKTEQRDYERLKDEQQQQRMQEFTGRMFGPQDAPVPGPYDSQIPSQSQGMFGSPQAQGMMAYQAGFPAEMAGKLMEDQGGKAREIKAADSNQIRKIVADSLGTEFNTFTGDWYIEDPEEKKKMIGLSDRAEQILKNNPGFGHAQAVARAMKEFNYDVPSPNMGGGKQKPSNFLGTYVPGQGFLR